MEQRAAWHTQQSAFDRDKKVLETELAESKALNQQLELRLEAVLKVAGPAEACVTSCSRPLLS